MTEDLKLEMNDYMPLRDVVFVTLRRAIQNGVLQPGERLMEIQLSRQLGVSRTPVREAIRKLEQEGLVITSPRRGAVVADITKADLEDVLEVRTVLEELAVRKACLRMGSKELAMLRQASEDFEECVRLGDLPACARSDEAFHEIISSFSGNRRLIHILKNIRGQVYRYRLASLKNKEMHPDLIREHRQLCDAISRADADAAAAIIRGHIERQRLAILESIKKNTVTSASV